VRAVYSGSFQWRGFGFVLSMRSIHFVIYYCILGTLKLDDNVKRWLVVGIALNTVLLSPLRNYLEPFIESHYESLKSSHPNIHMQSYASHLKKDGTATLNYGSINSNEAKKARNYDYCVTSCVDLAKLYLKPFMAKFAGQQLVVQRGCG